MGKVADITDYVRMQIMHFLLASCINGKAEYGKITEAAVSFHVSMRSVQRIWATAKQQRNSGESINVSSIRSQVIRKKKHEINYEVIQRIPVEERQTIQALSDALGIPKSVVGRWNTTHLLRPHTSNIRPLLTASNKLVRLSFSLQSIHYDAQSQALKFKPMENTIHIDEKWFYLTRDTCKYYLTPMEENPHRVCKSKSFIPKVMFMCAVSRPVFAEDGSVLFDGKIGIWPFIEEVTTRRRSINRPRGTRELRPMQNINRQVMRDTIIHQLIPTIKEKWPSCLSKNIILQQDNARPHINNTDPDFQAATNTDGFHMMIKQQPPNSPDCNALDLGFFCAIQCLQQRQRCKTAAELIEAVKTSFLMTDARTLNKVFLTLQCVLKKIMEEKGQNNFNPPHMRKNALFRQDMLPTNLEVPQHLVRESIDYLIREEFTERIQELMAGMRIRIPQNGEGDLDLNL